MPFLMKNWGAHLRSSGGGGIGGGSGNSSPSPQIDLCEICGKKPKFVDNGFKHPYCSRSCARSGGQGPSPIPCLLRGCRATGKPAFANFCSDVHAKEGVRIGKVAGCDQCKVQPRSVGNYCIPCERQEICEVRAQFLSEWELSGTVPTFEKVYEVVLPRESRARYDQYRAMNPSLAEVRTFHSSQCICDLGYKDTALCSFKSCGICCIVKSSFKSFAFGAPSNIGRFGDGVYSYRNPALADRFATSCASSPFRVLIACDACVEPNQCSDDDQESLFVPTSDALIPAYVIMYTR